MNQKFETIIKYLIGIEKGEDSLSKINIPEQFCVEKKDKPAIAKNLNAAFLIALSGKSHSLYKQALHYLNDFQTHPAWKNIVSFYKEGLDHIHSEITDRCLTDVSFKEQLNDLCAWISKPENRKQRKETIEKIWQMFFPEGVALSESKNRPEKIYQLRQKRKVKITKLNPAPITKPAEELLFTSNILVTLPFSDMDIDNLPIISSLRPKLKEIRQEPQVFWYDHPIPIGIDSNQNEAIYGLTGLDNAVNYEIQKGNAAENTKLTCVLSVSVTHKGLHDIIKKYLEEEIKKQKNMQHLDVYLFTEADTQKLIDKILVPIAEKEMGSKNYNLLYEIFGVDGEYGRHYSFLKAISAFWQVFINPKIKGTFKIDLDQVFPQEKLVEQTGISAFEHFKTLLWGAEGLDYEGNKVVLGMLAGALVNKEHIAHSLFYPDVDFPPQDVAADEIIFLSRLPQALSTAAEMITRYTDDILDGRNQVIQRVHVTGGTTGILVNALRKYRPFVPTFIGRAEDQAYILSVLFSGSPYLRYLHKDGLIMRHDKKAFAREVIKAAAMDKIIGDYLRILLFSYYVRALPWPFDNIKNAIAPFTGCFVSKIPLTVVYLRFAVKMSSLFIQSEKKKNLQGMELLQLGTKRLHETIQKLLAESNSLQQQFIKEKQGWNLFYDTLDTAEMKLQKNDVFTLELQKRALSLVKTCNLSFS